MPSREVIQPRLHRKQAEFLALPQRMRAFVAGYGSGKSWAGCCSLARHFWEFPGIDAGYFAPTYPQIRDIFYPTVTECFEDWGLNAVVRPSVHEVLVYDGAGRYRGTVKCRSMDEPESIVGFKIGRALVDEIDVMPADKAENVWRKIIARMRYKAKGLQNGVDVTTTPEGFRFVYSQFVRQVREKPELASLYGIVHASTWDNAANLPEDYIPSLMASYPAQLIEAYIDGQFVNLQSGTVYSAYDRALNASAESVHGGEPIFVGMDFNVGKMAAVIHVLRDGQPHAVDEITGAYDTPDMIRRLKERFWRHDGSRFVQTRSIRVYPDASGGSRKSVNASTSDLALLKDAGFAVSAGSANPPVKDRVNSMNAMFCNAKGERRYFVNASLCPNYAEALERQAWDKSGEPDKTSGYDHVCFAAGTLVKTPDGAVPIDRLPESGTVLTWNGSAVPYVGCGRIKESAETVLVRLSGGKTVRCTPEHLFLTEGGWICAKNLKGHALMTPDALLSLAMSSRVFLASDTTDAEARKAISGALQTLARKFSTELCGFITTEQSRINSTFTTLTEIEQTIKSKILDFFHGANTTGCTTVTPLPNSWSTKGSTWKRSDRWPQSGTAVQKGAHGTGCTRRKRRSEIIARFASIAAKSLTRFMNMNFSAQMRAARPQGAHPASMTRLVAASFAESLLLSINTEGLCAALENAEQCLLVETGKTESVYCLTVPSDGCFCLADGEIVGNCDAGGYYIVRDFSCARRGTSVSTTSTLRW